MSDPLRKLRHQWGFSVAAAGSFLGLTAASPEIGINTTSAIRGVSDDSGIIAGSSLLGPLFQYSGKRTTAKRHLSEDAEASLTFLQMTLKYKGTEDSVFLEAA